MSRQALVVLGMHRSGTSAVARVLSLLGATLPRDLMPAREDNVTGYWESRRVVQFNNRLLRSIGLDWDRDTPLPVDWFAQLRGSDLHHEAQVLLQEEFAAARLLVLKDPRLCRLFPFWERVLADEGVAPGVLLIMRDPVEVAGSLAHRFEDPGLRPASIPAPGRSLLLWLRCLLDAERHTRHLPRLALDYAALLSDWRTALAGICDLDPHLGAACVGPAAQAIDDFLDPGLRRQDAGRCHHRSETEAYLERVAKEVVTTVRGGGGYSFLDDLSRQLDRLTLAYEPLRRVQDRLCRRDAWSAAILQELTELCPPGAAPLVPPQARPRVVFFSRTPRSRAHVYRVIHPMTQLRHLGWEVEWHPTGTADAAILVHAADAVVVSRGGWGADFARIHRACAEKGVRLICDVDDLTFDAEVLTDGFFAYFGEVGEAERQAFRREADELRRALAASDAAFATTSVLARACAQYAPRAFVLPNCFGAAMVTAAEAWRQVPKPSSADGHVRVGFASGTPTHGRDFAILAEVLADVLAANPMVRLVVVGYLDLARFPCLAFHADRIEARPAVPLHELPAELARFDINLAPLEIGNPFCESKSQIRFTAAAALGIPTIAAATAPMQQAILDGETGLLAADAAAWRAGLQVLIDDPAHRVRLGEAARIDIRARFGPEKTRILARRFLSELLAVPGPRPAAAAASVAVAPQVIFIVSHLCSGSTWLAGVLGSHPRAANLGEHRQRFRGERAIECSHCWRGGRAHCEVLHGIAAAPLAEAYRLPLARFADRGVTTLIDSSQQLAWLRELQAAGACDSMRVKIVHLVRDPRGWLASALNRPAPMTVGPLLSEWKYHLRTQQDELSRAGLPVVRLCYDLACLEPDAWLAVLSRFTGLDHDRRHLAYWEYTHHAMAGDGAATEAPPGHDGRPLDGTPCAARPGRSCHDDRWRSLLDEDALQAVSSDPEIPQLLAGFGGGLERIDALLAGPSGA